MYTCIQIYVYMYTYVYTYIHTYMYTYVYIYIYTYIYVYIYIYMYVCIYIYIYIYIHNCVHARAYTQKRVYLQLSHSQFNFQIARVGVEPHSVHTHIYTCTSAYLCTYQYIHIHIHTHTLIRWYLCSNCSRHQISSASLESNLYGGYVD